MRNSRKGSRRGASGKGRDELNLAEFPVALIGKRPPGNVKTLMFEDQVWDRGLKEHVKRTLTVSGSDLWGLPTQFDDEVLLACIQLSKSQDFKGPRVEFTRYELLGLLDRPRDGRNYQRIAESLDRWAGTLFISDKAWWDKENQSWVKDTFNIIDRVNLIEKEDVTRRRRLGENSTPKSWFQWGDFMWNSFQAGNLKALDFEFWKSLRHSVSKRLYRILDKRFYHAPVVKFDLHTLAYEKIGLSRKMHTGQIKEKLRPANQELENRGVCRAVYLKKRPGEWEVIFERKKTQRKILNDSKHQLVQDLIARGVAEKKSSELVSKYSEGRVRAKVRLFDWEAEQGRRKQPGYLVAAINDNYPITDGMIPGKPKRQTRNLRGEKLKRLTEERAAKARGKISRNPVGSKTRQVDRRRIEANRGRCICRSKPTGAKYPGTEPREG